MPRSPNSSPPTRAVLASLSAGHPGWTHGYDLSRATGLKSGTLYPILQRLHAQGYLDARWEESPHPGKPPRHIYQLTPQGLELARPVKQPTGKLTLRGALG